MEPRPVSVSDAKQMLDRGDRVLFVDTRNPAAWSSSSTTLPDAIRVPADSLRAHLPALPREQRIIAYCT